MERRLFIWFLIIGLFCENQICLAEMCVKLTAMSGGEDHTLALADDNTLWACGSNGFKQLGLGVNVGQVSTLQRVHGENGNGFLNNVIIFDAGWYHSLAADSVGTLWAWGHNTDGQLGNGPDLDDCNSPTKVNGNGDLGLTTFIKYVSAGRSGKHSLAVDDEGYVYAFGRNDFGQCGMGEILGYESIYLPVLVHDDDPCTTGVYLGDIAHIVQADAGVYHSIALEEIVDGVGGRVWHWGQNSNTGVYPEQVTEPNTVPLTNITQISCSLYSIALDENGRVWQWLNSDEAVKVPDGEMNTSSGYLENIVEVGASAG